MLRHHLIRFFEIGHAPETLRPPDPPRPPSTVTAAPPPSTRLAGNRRRTVRYFIGFGPSGQRQDNTNCSGELELALRLQQIAETPGATMTEYAAGPCFDSQNAQRLEAIRALQRASEQAANSDRLRRTAERTARQRQPDYGVKVY
jgi:hypothetical protein